MSIFLLTLLLAFLAITTTTPTHAVVADRDSILMSRFSEWMAKHDIRADSDSVLAHMLSNWVDNDKYIKHVNSQNLSYTLGHNAFSGMNSEEFSQFMGFKSNTDIIGNGINKGLRGFSDSGVAVVEQEAVLDVSALPASVDWRAKGAVTPTKNQQSCGSCFSFSTTGALEGAYQIKYGNLVSFSEQQIVDCSQIKYGGPNMGCNGGQIEKSESWVGKNGGLCSEDSYPYVSGTTQTAGTCQKTCSLVSGSKIVSSTEVAANSDNAMMTALTLQPVSVGIQADQRDFQLYSGNVFTGTCGSSLDHAVLLVGYGVSNGIEYYILKNSWGTSWGTQGGYMLLGKGNDPATGKPYNGGKGQCGVLMEGVYPTL
jgi:C1A family cysteine protease